MKSAARLAGFGDGRRDLSVGRRPARLPAGAETPADCPATTRDRKQQHESPSAEQCDDTDVSQASVRSASLFQLPSDAVVGFLWVVTLQIRSE